MALLIELTKRQEELQVRADQARQNELQDGVRTEPWLNELDVEDESGSDTEQSSDEDQEESSRD